MAQQTRLQGIENNLKNMGIGNCRTIHDCLVWRIVDGGWIVGTDGVRKDGFIHDLQSCLDWFKWKLNIQ